MGVVFEGCDEVGELLIGDPAQLADPFTGVDPSTWPCRSSAAATRGSAQYGDLMPTIPPHVEYTLTPMGREVASRLVALIEHVESLVPEVERARARYDRR